MWMNEENFTQLVKEHFGFLQEKYNMKIQNKKVAECVRFKSSIAWIEIWFDKYSLFIVMGTKDRLYQMSLWDIMQYASGEENDASYMASDEGSLNKGLQRLSNYVKLYCHKALLGDIEFYKEIQKRKEQREKACDYKNEINNIEKEARIAWEKKDY